MKKNYKILFKNSNKCDSIEIFSFAIHPFDLIVKKKKKEKYHMDKSKSCKHNIYKVTHIKKKEKSSCLKFGEKKNGTNRPCVNRMKLIIALRKKKEKKRKEIPFVEINVDGRLLGEVIVAQDCMQFYAKSVLNELGAARC